MPLGGLPVASLRHRPRQAIFVCGLSALITASAALGPMFAASAEQDALSHIVDAATADAVTLVVTDASDSPDAPEAIERAVAAVLPAPFGRPVGGREATVVLSRSGGDFAARLVSRARLCANLEFAAGRCPATSGEVAVSERSAAAIRAGPGDDVTLLAGSPGDSAVRVTGRVVGVYRSPDATSRYWSGRVWAPRVASVIPASDSRPATPVDEVFTQWSTLASTPWPDLRTYVDVPVRGDRLTVDSLPEVRAATHVVDRRVATFGASATSSIGALLDSTVESRSQVRDVVPVLAGQLALLGVLVLAFVCVASSEVRRPELALARLRGQGAIAPAGMLLRELGPVVVAGATLGTGVAWAVAAVTMPASVGSGHDLGVRVPVAVAVAASVLTGLLSLLLSAVPSTRLPLTVLLRRVPPRGPALRAGLVEGLVVAAALAALVTVVSGASSGIAPLAPGLLAVAGGLLMAQAAGAVVVPLARAALHHGRLPWALAGLQLARRPALRRLVVIITVATALLVFAVDAWAVSGRNRLARAEVESGAPVVLTVDATDPAAFRRAVLAFDPGGRFATPVVTARTGTPVGPVTTAVEPAAFGRIAQWRPAGSAPSAGALAALRPKTVPPVLLPVSGVSELAVTATYTVRPLPRPAGFQGDPSPVGFVVYFTPQDGGEKLFYDLASLRPGRHIYRTTIDCTDCALAGFEVQRKFGDSYPIALWLALEKVAVGTPGVSLDLGPRMQVAWQVRPTNVGSSAVVRPGPPLTIVDDENSYPIGIQRGDVPALTPALTAGALSSTFRNSAGGPARPRLAPDFGGEEHQYLVVGRLPQVPRSGPRGAVVDLATLAKSSPPAGPDTSYAVWLAAQNPQREAALRRGLTERGLRILGRDTTEGRAEALAGAGPVLALRAGVIPSLVAALLGALTLLISVATSSPTRINDLAGLRVVGVPAALLRQACICEHVVVAWLGVLTGAVLGLAAALVALPQIPLFAQRSPQLPLDLAPAWASVTQVVAGCLVLFAAVSVVAGRSLALAAVPARLRAGP